MIFETHAHYDDDAFDDDRDKLLEQLPENGVGRVVNSGASMKSSRAAIELAKKYDFVYASVGVHPDNAGELNEEAFEELRTMVKYEKTVAVGEIGLDYHWNVWPKDVQKEAFIRQWELATGENLPIVIHSRDAAQDTFEIIKEMYEKEKAAGRELRADMHCYSYHLEQAREYVKMGLYFGIGGIVTFKNAGKLPEIVKELPIERILLETDCPYLTPEPFRRQRNDSAKLKYVVDKIAEIKGMSPEEVNRQTEQNAERFFCSDERKR